MISTFRPQRTIAHRVGLEGFGYWSGQDVRVEFHPAPPNHGLVFNRTDRDEVRIPALVEHRHEVPRRTNLVHRGVSVEMVEHVLAALVGLRIDNCEIRVNAAEMPGVDGSCWPFVEALQQAGVVEQSVRRQVVIVQKTLRVGDSDAWVEIRPHQIPALTVEYHLDYGADHVLGSAKFGGTLTPDFFATELAQARTFIMQHEADWLRAQGIGQRVGPNDLLVFDDQGPQGNSLRFPDECVRHKTLDLVGDLALSGCDLWGSVRAYRSGHRLNADLVSKLLDTHSITHFLRHSA